MKLVRIVGAAYLLALCFFGWGFAAAKYQIFPIKFIEPGLAELTAYFAESNRGSVKDIVQLDHQERRNQFDFSGLKVSDTEFRDDGFLLISRYSKEHGQTVVQLFDISANRVVHTWVPDLNAIFKMTPDNQGEVNTRLAYRSQHPLLLRNGDLLIGSGEGPLVKINSCGKPIWAIDRHFHHSIELDAEGNIVAPIDISEGVDEYGVNVRNEGFAVISPDGKILAEYGVRDLLINNGYRGLIFGVGEFEKDRYHLNDVQPLRGKSVAQGVLLSIRNLSTLALFVPATGKIQWLKTGPWLNQHDVNELPGGQVSVFGNNHVRGTDKTLKDEFSEVYVFSPASGEIRTPFTKALAKAQMRSLTEGVVTILDNGDAFIEETTRDRLLRVSSDKIRWEYVSPAAKTTTGALHWSRYISRSALKAEWLKGLKCE